VRPRAPIDTTSEWRLTGRRFDENVRIVERTGLERVLAPLVYQLHRTQAIDWHQRLPVRIRHSWTG
jgi:hypothetical protein